MKFKLGNLLTKEITIWKVRLQIILPLQFMAFGHPLYYENIIQVMRGIAEPNTDGREGLKSLELLIAAYMAARDGTTVGLPLHF